MENNVLVREAIGVDGQIYQVPVEVEAPAKAPATQSKVAITNSSGVIMDFAEPSEVFAKTRAAALAWDWD